MIALPAETGYNPLCDDKEYLPRLKNVGDFFPKGQQFQCTLEQGSWSLGISILWITALLIAMRLIWRQWRQAPAKVWSHEERQNVLLQTARSMLLIGAALTFVLYVLSPSPAFQPLGTVRYLICLLLALPVILWPLWHGISISIVAGISSKWRVPTGFIWRMGILLFLAITFVRGSIDALTGIPVAQTAYAQQETLVHELLQLGARHIYSDYDTCNPLIFQSHERIICTSLQIKGQQLQLGLNRYPPYLALMKLTSYPTYVYRLTSPEVVILDQGTYRLNKHYQRIVFGSYVVYIYRTQTRPSSA